ncbi:MAG: AbrB/MazE/SpoVT family DNA-binding domain-containing protein [Treponema sp.]|nr:AbrB/MazE/SpoVT family DNA-binding domain-containing protein [Spirochaetia bacterium]MDD7458945.1 AbrB/MazE/SpoVT family DNA-binding domain-containing protein [Spirochaetales bacterium]MDD7610631.1 AbrB/MazE/SpoVT family DNA-binding domain-containing protein [Spirochaetales bacterium]MDY5810999.1 AbrB/MazE/SpoVT family DNA-binding domain-containing protein [Treponema sp.]MDY5915293.1 AbrB/MazE/SpoVT family DNA-binding domain-containing protein [Treponema sp.]
MLVSVVQIGNSRGIRFPKLILDKFFIKDKMDMEVTEKGILLTPVKDVPRADWAQKFSTMHENKEDVLEDIPDSGDFEWEWK